MQPLERFVPTRDPCWTVCLGWLTACGAARQAEQRTPASQAERQAPKLHDGVWATYGATTWDGQTVTKAQLIAGGGSAIVTFRECGLQLFGPTAVTRGRIRVERDGGSSEQRFIRIYSKRDGRWQAVAVQVYPVA